MVNAIIVQIRAYNASLADALTQVMNNFEYDEILTLVQNTERR